MRIILTASELVGQVPKKLAGFVKCPSGVRGFISFVDYADIFEREFIYDSVNEEIFR